MPIAAKLSRKRPAGHRRSKTNTKKHTQISIVGAGRLGTALGRALRLVGYQIKLVVTTRLTSARRASRLIGGDELAASAAGSGRLRGTAGERLLQSDLIIVSTPDDTLAAVTRQLSEIFRSENLAVRRRKHRVVLHTSGAIASEVLRPLRTSGLAIGSLHPLVSVADVNVPAEIFHGVHFCLEGDREAVRAARSLVTDLRGNSFTIDANSKALYHAAAVMSAGHVVALFDLAIELLATCGLSRQRARQVLVPLLNSTAVNLSTKTTAQALTGPFARGDFETVKKHLEAIEASTVEESLAVYVSLGQHAMKLAAELSSDLRQTDRIAKLLSSRP